MRKNVPNGRLASIFRRRAFDLVRGSGRSPEKAGGEAIITACRGAGAGRWGRRTRRQGGNGSRSSKIASRYVIGHKNILTCNSYSCFAFGVGSAEAGSTLSNPAEPDPDQMVRT